MAWGLVFVLLGSSLAAAADTPATAYRELVATDQPVWFCRFDDVSDGSPTAVMDGGTMSGRVVGQVAFDEPGPPHEQFPAFDPSNRAAAFDGKNGSIRFSDPGEDSPLDFAQGDTISLEAWVNPQKLGNGQQIYIIGKGRTGNPGVAKDNQNYALRLTGSGGLACLSFLFRSAGEKPEFHRWNSVEGFGLDGQWHHVAVSYTFGEPKSIRCYIDGEAVTGKWDYGGATEKPPVVDDDELWIGSSMGGNPSSTFSGLIDEVAIYRRALSPERIQLRHPPAPPRPWAADDELPAQGVLVEVLEGVPDKMSWKFVPKGPFERYVEPAFAFIDVPQKYNAHGVRVDRGNPFLVRASARMTLPEGKHRLLLRSFNAARLYLDGELIVENPFPPPASDGHNEVYIVASDVSPNVRPLQPGHEERVAEIVGDGQPHRIDVEFLAGGRKRRPELGETSVSLATLDGDFTVLSHTLTIPLTDFGWLAFVREQRERLFEVNQERRRQASTEYAKYWARRHAEVRRKLAETPGPEIPTVSPDLPVQNEIDRFIGYRLEQAGVTPTLLTDDWSFLRRVCLDVIGTIPTPEIAETFLKDEHSDRRARLIDRLLEHRGWADHWVSYWQDVLAENPNIVNPTLNNTGPFRWWIHESFADNKPFDRFVTELILMEGSTHFGGPGGFGLATQNDAPMAAKAHIVAQAFLAVDMRCARCHDAPFHDVSQRDLFSLAAMLARGPQEVPKTSTIPGDPKALQSMLVKVTLRPGEKVPPQWPFEEFVEAPPLFWLDRPTDNRERLAALVTSPENERFASVIVNRVWQRYLGRGLVEPVDDWEGAEPSHPGLLAYLARELMTHNYDLKHLARLILNSHAYQRSVDPAAESDRERAALFAGPQRRRMTAEQIVDSLFTAAGKPFNTEELSVDVDARRAYTSSLNLGVPTRAWQFTSSSNERDRPSLSLPVAQTFINLLETFGWRASRQDPITVRDNEPTALQPAVLANGVVAKRITQLSDDSAFTELALREEPLEEYVDQVVRRVLTRPATSQERVLFQELLSEGYADRRVTGDVPVRMPGPPKSTGVTWTNHLKPKANELKLELDRQIQHGDPVTLRLQRDWRERAEDMVWALINSPEFVFIP